MHMHVRVVTDIRANVFSNSQDCRYIRRISLFAKQERGGTRTNAPRRVQTRRTFVGKITGYLFGKPYNCAIDNYTMITMFEL